MFSAKHKAVLGRVAGIISFLAFLPYIWSILQGSTEPSRATWFIWSFVGLIILTSYRASDNEGTENTKWLTISYFVCPSIIAILSIWYGEGGLNTLDKFCLFGAGIACIPWLWLKVASWTLVLSLVVDFIGAIPTISKSWQMPNTESTIAWTIAWLGSALNLLAVKKWEGTTPSHPVYMAGINSLIVIPLWLQ